jgi:hypothetical protein
MAALGAGSCTWRPSTRRFAGRNRPLSPKRQRGGLAGAARTRSSGDAGCFRALANRHARVEARKPSDDFVTRDRRVSELAMLLRSLARSEYARRHGSGADEFAHGPMDLAHIEQVILLAFSQQDILLHVMQYPVERVLCYRGEEVERRLGAGNVHSLDNAPFEYGARQALPGD